MNFRKIFLYIIAFIFLGSAFILLTGLTGGFLFSFGESYSYAFLFFGPFLAVLFSAFGIAFLIFALRESSHAVDLSSHETSFLNKSLNPLISLGIGTGTIVVLYFVPFDPYITIILFSLLIFMFAMGLSGLVSKFFKKK